MMWSLVPEIFRDRLSKGYIKIGKYMPNAKQQFVIQYLMSGTIKDIIDGKIEITGKSSDGSVIGRNLITKTSLPKSQWDFTLHDARNYGTKILGKIFNGVVFSFPKSLYAVHDCIKLFLANKQNALVVDFFAGSGTTLHAVNLLNFEDNGKRRCIMVTNNEVSDNEASLLRNKGINPSDEEWEQLGVASYITWPRTKCSILGIDVNGNALAGEYVTSLKNEIKITRKINQIALNSSLLSFEAKKSIVAMMGANTLSQSLVKNNTHYIVSDKYNTSIIFNLEYVDEWLAELGENTQVTDVYIVTDNNKAFKKLKEEVRMLMGDIITEAPVKLPMSEGFKANVEYFKLGFLDKTMVKIGKQFKELLPILWMKSGAVGARPELGEGKTPDMLVLPKNKMAILVNDNKFYDFKQQLEKNNGIEYVYIVTNYDNGYRAKIAELNVKNTYQLYRDYLDNFRINYRR